MVVHKCRAKLRILNQQIDDLEKERAAVEWYVKEATTGKEDEKKWLDDVPDLLDRAKKVIDEVIKYKEQNNCSIVLNPDAKSPDLLSKEADTICDEIFKRVQKARRFEIPISYRQDKNAVDGFREIESRTKLLERIMDALQESGKSVIGVHGLPGVGKTMLLREIKRRFEENNFDAVVVMVAVTRNPNLSRIRDEIARGLGIYPFSHQFVSHSQPQAQVTNERIKAVLAEKKVLLIFDDIWAKLDWEELGIRSGFMKCKFLLTYGDRDSRSLLSELGCQENFQVFPLIDEESKSLFDKIAADQSENRSLPIYTTDLAKKCEGLPLAIAALANALKGRSLIEWMITLKQLEISDEKFPTLNSALRLACGDLKNKQDFLLCCLLDRNATILDLLKYGTGLGLFPAVNSRKESWDQASAFVRKLRDSSLLLDGASNMFFDVNALVRDTAVAVGSKELDVLALREDDTPTDRPEMDKLRWIYISKGHKDWLPDELECPQLTFFHLSSKDKESSLEIPPGFFKGSKKIRVLGLTEMHFSSIPSSIRHLKDLHTLRLDRSFLEGSDIGAVIGELVDLQVLSLAGCDIKELPEAIAKLTKLEVLDLSDCCELKVIPSGVLSSLIKLEELYMGNSFDQWCDVEEHGDKKNASAAELTHLNLIALEVCIKSCNTKMIQEILFSENLQRYKVFVGDVWNYWGGSFESSDVLKLQLDGKITFGDSSVKKLLKKSDELHLEGLNGVRDLLNDLDDEGFQKLKFLLVQDAPDIQRFVNSGTSNHCNAFPILEVLVLRNLGNMLKICPVPLGDASFGKLSRITVENCDQLEYLFSFFIARHLMHLQEIAITDCKNIVEILSFREDGVRSDVEAAGEAEPHKLLRSLRLQNLQNLVSFNSCGSHMTLFNERVDFPRLEELHLSGINFHRIWDCPATSYSIQNLTKLIIESCDNLQYIFSCSLAKNLEKVKHLEISKCKKMTEIILAESENGSGDTISFPKLNFLQITELESLTGFCSKALSIEFPLLEKLVLKNCPNFKGFTVTQTDLNVTDDVQPLFNKQVPLFNKQVSFPSLEIMTISDMENVRVLWQSQIHEGSFKKLKSIEVDNCKRLLYVFPSNSMFGRFLKSLEVLSIIQCGSLRAVFELGGLNAKGKRVAIDTQLKELVLSHLQRLKCVWSEDPNGTLSFKNLQSVIVQYCNKLKNLFPASVAQSLSNLHNLKVHRCWVEGIVELKREGSEGSELVYKLVFPQGKLKYFHSGKHQWPVSKQMEQTDVRSKLDHFSYN